MPVHPLSHDRSVQIHSGPQLWDVVTPAVRGQRGAVTAAVAFVGENAEVLLPLGPGATIIVNAGTDAMREGATDPRMLLSWHRRGVRVHSLATLTTTLILVEARVPFAVVGSANATPTLAADRDDAVTVTDLPGAIEDARMALLEWLDRAGSPLTEDWLQEAVREFGSRSDRAPGADTSAWADDDADPGATEAPDPEVTGFPEEPEVRDAPPVVAAPVTASPATSPPVTASAPVAAATPVIEVPDFVEEPEPQVVTFDWARPRTLYLAPMTPHVGLPDHVLERVERFYSELGLSPASGRAPHREGSFSVETYWEDEELGRGNPFAVTFLPNSSVIAVESATARPGRNAVMFPPARVLGVFVDERPYPRRRYFFLLTRWWTPQRSYRDAVGALAAVGEKAKVNQPYFVDAKLNALLGLWPGASYDS